MRFADDDVCIGPPQGRLSYLRIPSIIAAAEVTGRRDPPGYGFLAENSEFADICAASNITSRPDRRPDPGDGRQGVRPAACQRGRGSHRTGSAGVIATRTRRRQSRGDRLPGDHQGHGRRRRQGDADRERCEQFAHLFSLAQNEALSAFGNGDVYVEKFLARPRHVEIQVIGDQHGRVVHLGERDCSVQRRHQKLIEESPSPALTDELRQQMGDAAVRLSEAIKYVGAGTIEFLLDEDGSFYFWR